MSVDTVRLSDYWRRRCFALQETVTALQRRVHELEREQQLVLELRAVERAGAKCD